MKIKLTKARMLEGFTYEPGEHEVSEYIGGRLLHNFPNVCSEVKVKLLSFTETYEIKSKLAAQMPAETEKARRSKPGRRPVDVDGYVTEATEVEPVIDGSGTAWVDSDLPPVESIGPEEGEPTSWAERDKPLSDLPPVVVDGVDATASAKSEALKLKVDLSTVTGTGKSGKILVRDVREAAKDDKSI